MRARTGVGLAAVFACCVVACGCAAPGERTGGGASEARAPRAVSAAGTTEIPACTSYVDAAGGGTFSTIAEAVEAATNGEVICVAEGTYSGERLTPGEKYFTIAGGFRSGSDFTVRDSAAYVSRVEGGGTGSFYQASDPAPKDDELVTIDGFDISGYAQAVSRSTYFTGRIDITNNVFHDNACNDPALIGAAFSLSNVTATIEGNVFTRNSCGRAREFARRRDLPVRPHPHHHVECLRRQRGDGLGRRTFRRCEQRRRREHHGAPGVERLPRQSSRDHRGRLLLR